MQLLGAALLPAALPFGLAKGDAKTVEVVSIPGCTQYMTVDGATVPACMVETVTQETTVTSIRQTGASGVAGPSGGSAPAFTYDPMWTNTTNSAASTSTYHAPPSSGLGTQPLPIHTSSFAKRPSSHSKQPTSSTHASSGFSLSPLSTGTTSGSFGPYLNSSSSFTMPHASFASGLLGTAPYSSSGISHKPKTHSREASSKSVADHASTFTKTVIITATITVDGTEIETTSALLTEISGKSSLSLPGIPSSVPANGPPEVTKAATKASEKPSVPVKPTSSCTLARNPHFGKCVLKDVDSKAKVNGTAALVTASGSPVIYKAICDCKRIPNISTNHTMPVPVEVCGSLMCPNEMVSKPEQPPQPPVPAGPDAEKSGFKTSPKPPKTTATADATGSGAETSSKHDSNSEKSSHTDESVASHTGTVTGRVTVNVPVPTNAISSATEAAKSSPSAKAASDVVESIWDSITSRAAEQASVTLGV